MKVDRLTRYDELPDLLTVEEFRNYLGLGRSTAYERVRTGQIQCVRFGTRIWIPREVVKVPDFSVKGNEGQK
jgi:excisionase family DNA binding protein